MSASLNLIHHTKCRWRFKICDAQILDWRRLEIDLESVFPRSSWSLRLNSIAESIIICYKKTNCQTDTISSFVVRDCLVKQLNRQGLSIAVLPLSQVEVIKDSLSPKVRHLHKIVHSIFNAISLSMAFSLICMSLLLFLLGLLGLFIPFTPGLWVLMMATIIFDMAISLRSPFVRSL